MKKKNAAPEKEKQNCRVNRRESKDEKRGMGPGDR